MGNSVDTLKVWAIQTALEYMGEKDLSIKDLLSIADRIEGHVKIPEDTPPTLSLVN